MKHASILLPVVLAACAPSITSGYGDPDRADEFPDGGVGDPTPSPTGITCDTGLGNLATDLAKAMELCDGSLISATLQAAGPGQSGVVVGSYGASYTPQAGAAMATLASGDVSPLSDKDDGGAYEQPSSHPSPRPAPNDGCGQADPSQVMDMVKLELTLQAPATANGFQFQFNFMSAEFPEYHCTEYDDTFLAVLESSTLSENISFDENNNVISINTGFFDVCNPAHASTCKGDAELAGTGYQGRGGTGWLTTQAPITGGESFTLTFYLFDEGDPILSSQVLLDKFEWLYGEVDDDPITID